MEEVLRALAHCGDCGAWRCIFSKGAVGTKDGPTQAQVDGLHGSLEKGYSCGGKVKSFGGKFFSRRAVRCIDPIESQLYNPATGTKGGRIITDPVCSLCYVKEDLVPVDELIMKCNVGGKLPLTICKACFDTGVVPPCSGARKKNVVQATRQAKVTKKRQLNDAVRQGRRKSRRG